MKKALENEEEKRRRELTERMLQATLEGMPQYDLARMLGCFEQAIYTLGEERLTIRESALDAYCRKRGLYTEMPVDLRRKIIKASKAIEKYHLEHKLGKIMEIYILYGQ